MNYRCDGFNLHCFIKNYHTDYKFIFAAYLISYHKNYLHTLLKVSFAVTCSLQQEALLPIYQVVTTTACYKLPLHVCTNAKHCITFHTIS